MADKATIAIGVVGCGAVAQVAHLPALASIEGADVCAVCDEDAGRAATVAGRFGVPTSYASLDELLGHDGLQAVIVCTPNYLHADNSESALRAGLHVLCERPLGINSEQTERLLATAKETDRHLMVAHNHRYRPDAWALRQAIERGELGEIFHVHASWQRRRTRRPRRRDWRRNMERAGGGVLMDLGVTNLDLGLWLLSYPIPERVTAHVVDRDGDGLEDTAVVALRLEGESTLGVDVSWDLIAHQDRHTVFALGANGSGSLSPFVISKEEEEGVVVEVTPRLARGTENVYTASYRRELQHFLAVVRGDSQPRLPEEQATLMRVVDASYRSAEEGREVVL